MQQWKSVFKAKFLLNQQLPEWHAIFSDDCGWKGSENGYWKVGESCSCSHITFNIAENLKYCGWHHSFAC